MIGAYSQGDNGRDETEGTLEEGHDTATRVENRLHGAHSYLGGIYGYIDFKINTRLTQSVNHYLRSRLFDRIKALPMTALEEGQLREAGSHDELMTVPDGHYRRFVELQTVAVQHP